MSELYKSIMRGLEEIIEDQNKPEEEQILRRNTLTVPADCERSAATFRDSYRRDETRRK